MSDIEVHSDHLHITDEGYQAMGEKLAGPMKEAIDAQVAQDAHAALKAWSDTDEGKAAIEAVGGVHQSNPLYLAFMAGYYAALNVEASR